MSLRPVFFNFPSASTRTEVSSNQTVPAPERSAASWTAETQSFFCISIEIPEVSLRAWSIYRKSVTKYALAGVTSAVPVDPVNPVR